MIERGRGGGEYSLYSTPEGAGLHKDVWGANLPAAPISRDLGKTEIDRSFRV